MSLKSFIISLLLTATSWAAQNREAEVWYVLTSPVVDDSDGLLTKLHGHYHNLHVVTAHLDAMFSQTPLKDVFASGNWSRNTTWPENNLSNLLRNVLVWFWGGFYSDVDTVCLRNVTHLHNVISYLYDGDGVANNALMHFRAQHPFIYLIMEHLKQNFRVATWHVNSAGAATRVLQEMCNTTFLDDVLDGLTNCSDVSLLPQELIQPMSYYEWMLYFDPSQRHVFEKLMKSVYVLHTWNRLSKLKPIVVGSESIYEVAARTCCPVTYAQASSHSGFF